MMQKQVHIREVINSASEYRIFYRLILQINKSIKDNSNHVKISDAT